jgi:hypothetical protein
MDSTPSKRRKISNARPLSVDTSNTDLGFQDVNHENGRRRGRPSFSAPTRASLARFNPDILARSQGVQNGTQSGSSSPRRLNPTALRTTATTRYSASPAQETSTEPGHRVRPVSGGLGGPARNRSPQARNTKARNSVQDQEAAERSLLEEERLADVVRRPGQKQGSSRNTFLNGRDKPLEEPELPPTPQELGLEGRPRPPAGELSSSPISRLSLRRKPSLKGSPLKPEAISMEQLHLREGDPNSVADKSKQPSPKDPSPEVKENEEVVDEEVLRKRQIVDQLAEQYQSLQSDITFLEREVRLSQRNQTDPRPNLHRLV